MVDDEPLLREVARRMLSKSGYTVHLAADGVEAVELYRERGDQVAAVVLDLMMPEMDGAETFTRLREIDPEVRVLLTSGYSRDEAVEELLAAGARGFIEKPFESSALVQAVAEVLNDSGVPATTSDE